MGYLYSKTTGGFYHSDIHVEGVPANAVEVADDVHAAMMAAQASGQAIAPDANGNPIAVDRASVPLTPDQVRAGILNQIMAAEAKQARPLRELLVAQAASPVDQAMVASSTQRLVELNSEIAALRAQLPRT